MEIKYYSDNKLIVGDDLKEITFLDLAKIEGYHIEGNPTHHWVIYQYKELIAEKKIEFSLGTAYHNTSGNLAQLYFGYFINRMNRRTIELNEDGTVSKDTIIVFDPRRFGNNEYFYSTSPLGVELEEYLSDEQRFYENYNKTERIKNRILDDEIVRYYIYYNNRYCKILNNYSDDYKTVKDLFSMFDDEIYLRLLETGLRKKEEQNSGIPKR